MRLAGSCLLATFCAGLAIAPAGATEVALVLEDNSVLKQIAEGFSGAFKGSIETVTFEASAPGNAASRILAARPKAVVALGPRVAKEIQPRIGDLPLLVGGVLNPEKIGLDVGKIGRVPMTAPVKRQWAIALRALKAKRFGVVLSADNDEKAEEAEEAGRELGVEVAVSRVGDKGLSAALSVLDGRVDVLWVPLDPAVASQDAFPAIVSFSVKNRLPLIVPTATYVKKGGLISVSLSYSEMGRQLAEQAKAVVAGAAPKSTSSKTSNEEISVNLVVAPAVGVTFSPDFLKTVTSKVE